MRNDAANALTSSKKSRHFVDETLKHYENSRRGQQDEIKLRKELGLHGPLNSGGPVAVDNYLVEKQGFGQLTQPSFAPQPGRPLSPLPHAAASIPHHGIGQGSFLPASNAGLQPIGQSQGPSVSWHPQDEVQRELQRFESRLRNEANARRQALATGQPPPPHWDTPSLTPTSDTTVQIGLPQQTTQQQASEAIARGFGQGRLLPADVGLLPTGPSQGPTKNWQFQEELQGELQRFETQLRDEAMARRQALAGQPPPHRDLDERFPKEPIAIRYQAPGGQGGMQHPKEIDDKRNLDGIEDTRRRTEIAKNAIRERLQAFEAQLRRETASQRRLNAAAALAGKATPTSASKVLGERPTGIHDKRGQAGTMSPHLQNSQMGRDGIVDELREFGTVSPAQVRGDRSMGTQDKRGGQSPQIGWDGFADELDGAGIVSSAQSGGDFRMGIHDTRDRDGAAPPRLKRATPSFSKSQNPQMGWDGFVEELDGYGVASLPQVGGRKEPVNEFDRDAPTHVKMKGAEAKATRSIVPQDTQWYSHQQDPTRENKSTFDSIQAQRDTAATKIQAAHRGRRARRSYEMRLEQHKRDIDTHKKRTLAEERKKQRAAIERQLREIEQKEQQRAAAAVQIQASFRGRAARQNVQSRIQSTKQELRARELEAEARRVQAFEARERAEQRAAMERKIREIEQQRTAAAQKIQSGLRGRMARRSFDRRVETRRLEREARALEHRERAEALARREREQALQRRVREFEARRERAAVKLQAAMRGKLQRSVYNVTGILHDLRAEEFERVRELKNSSANSSPRVATPPGAQRRKAPRSPNSDVVDTPQYGFVAEEPREHEHQYDHLGQGFHNDQYEQDESRYVRDVQPTHQEGIKSEQRRRSIYHEFEKEGRHERGRRDDPQHAQSTIDPGDSAVDKRSSAQERQAGSESDKSARPFAPEQNQGGRRNSLWTAVSTAIDDFCERDKPYQDFISRSRRPLGDTGNSSFSAKEIAAWKDEIATYSRLIDSSAPSGLGVRMIEEAMFLIRVLEFGMDDKLCYRCDIKVLSLEAMLAASRRIGESVLQSLESPTQASARSILVGVAQSLSGAAPLTPQLATLAAHLRDAGY